MIPPLTQLPERVRRAVDATTSLPRIVTTYEVVLAALNAYRNSAEIRGLIEAAEREHGLVFDCPFGWVNGRVVSHRSTTNEQVLEWLQGVMEANEQLLDRQREAVLLMLEGRRRERLEEIARIKADTVAVKK